MLFILSMLYVEQKKYSDLINTDIIAWILSSLLLVAGFAFGGLQGLSVASAGVSVSICIFMVYFVFNFAG